MGISIFFRFQNNLADFLKIQIRKLKHPHPTRKNLGYKSRFRDVYMNLNIIEILQRFNLKIF
jgi:hypothetical protein